MLLYYTAAGDRVLHTALNGHRRTIGLACSLDHGRSCFTAYHIWEYTKPGVELSANIPISRELFACHALASIHP